MDLITSIYINHISTYSCFMMVFYTSVLIGAFKLFFFTFGLFSMITHSLFRGGLGHLKQRYGRKDGKPTWAVVTGASDGIGLAFCK